MVKLEQSYITGFTDAEGSFGVSIRKCSKHIQGFRVSIWFTIGVHKKDLGLLMSIKNFFNGVGFIGKLADDSVQYRVTSLKDLEVLIAHFDKYPLMTQKLADYTLFRLVYELVSTKKHLTK